MSWQKYELTFRLLSPMHIGWRTVSNLQQTRSYVPGKVLWAALTARLTREAEQGAVGSAYVETGNLLQQYVRFGYLYPALQEDDTYKVYYPWENEAEFDYLFLNSYTSAALNYDSNSAEDGMLHETEYIAPYTRDGRTVYLKGVLYVQENLPAPLQTWQDALNKLQFGGERGYGWGRVKLIPCQEVETIPDAEILVSPVNGRIPAHLIAANTTNIQGQVEPLTGWERNNQNNQSTYVLSRATICYAPGTPADPTQQFTITANGLWQLHHS